MIVEGNHLDSLLDNENAAVTEEPIAPAIETGEVDDQTKSAANQSPEESFTGVEAFLNAFGLRDGKFILMEDEEGNQTEVDFNTLDKDEQLNVLRELTSPGLSDTEVETINYMRKHNLSMQEMLDKHAKEAIHKYIEENGSARTYTIDEYDDDTLFVADLQSRYSDLTQEELQQELEVAKSNEALFKKKVDAIRTQYKTLEDQRAEERIQEEQQRFEEAKNQVASALEKFDNIKLDHTDDQSYGLSIEDNEREEIMRYITTRDEQGMSQFFKDLNNPETLVRLAWFNLFGQDAITGITHFWQGQLREAKKQNQPTPKSTTKTAIIPQEDSTKPSKDKTINALYDGLI